MAPILLSTPEIFRFVIVLLRISGLMFFAPLFSSQTIPMMIRAAFVFVAALILTPSLPLNAVPAELSLGVVTSLVASEMLSGVLLGFAAACVFAGLQYAGQIISFQLGFSLINQIDPQTNVEAPVFSFIQNYIGLLFFMLLNGHHWFLLAVNQSFSILPVGGIHLQMPVVEHLVSLSSQIFVIGLRVAGPVMAVTIITDVILGIIGRAAPQIHILIIGMPLKLLVGFGCLSFSFYFLPRYLESVFSMLYRALFSLIQAMA
jgi:flagellar biosynthesis protein FliR